MEEFRVISLVLHLRGLSQKFLFGSLIIGEMPNHSRSRSRRHGRSNQRKWRHENPTRCWLTGRKRCGTSVWRSRKASNRYLQGVLAPHAENGLKSRLQIWKIMHTVTYGYDTGSRRLSTWGLLYDARWLCECNSDPRLISYGLFEQQRLPTRSIGMSRLLIAGHDAAAKARRTFETVLARTRRKLKSALSFQVLVEFSSVLFQMMHICNRLFLDAKSKAWRWRISLRRDLKRWAQVILIQTSPKLRPQRLVMTCNAKAVWSCSTVVISNDVPHRWLGRLVWCLVATIGVEAKVKPCTEAEVESN